MNILAESIDLGTEFVFFVIGWYFIAFVIGISIGIFFTFIGKRIAVHRARKVSKFESLESTFKPYLITSGIFLLIGLASFIVSELVFCMVLLPILNMYIGYIYTIPSLESKN